MIAFDTDSVEFGVGPIERYVLKVIVEVYDLQVLS